MAIQEKATEQKAILLATTAITSATTTNSSTLDTKDYDAGVYFLLGTSAFDSTGTITYTIYEDSASDMGTESLVASGNLVYGTATALSAVNAAGSNIVHEGVFGTKRYLRVKMVTSAGITSITPLVVAIVNPETLPTAKV